MRGLGLAGVFPIGFGLLLHGKNNGGVIHGDTLGDRGPWNMGLEIGLGIMLLKNGGALSQDLVGP